MFDELHRREQDYQRAMAHRPYDPDLVQGLGMRFCDEWKARKYDILEALNEPEFITDSKGKQEENFSYAKWRTWVPRLSR